MSGTLVVERLQPEDLTATPAPAAADAAGLLCSDPACCRPAVVEDRRMLASTDGPLEMVKVRCERGCWFLLPAADLEQAVRQSSRS